MVSLPVGGAGEVCIVLLGGPIKVQNVRNSLLYHTT